MNNLKKRLLVSTGLAFLISLPIVFAFPRSGVGILDGPIEMISNLFNISVISENPFVQEGFMRLCLFIVVYSLAYYSLSIVFSKGANAEQGKKTAGIISFAFSMIGIFMMPPEWFDATGGLVAGILTTIPVIAVFVGLAYVAVMKLNENLFQNFLGFVLLFILLCMLGVVAGWAGIPLTTPDIATLTP
jgi:hypothetical protein